ncbi:MAG: hypothetical protein CMN31_28560 [Sandaracinus sp.]|nr:hypothetical protein [Sandaracinus sp.]
MPLVLKRLVTLALLAAVVALIATHEGVADIPRHLAALDPSLLLLALALPALAVLASVRRWQLLLAHEGLELPFPTLLGSFLRGRFVGAFTPSTTGLDLYRLVDVARLTGERAKSARVVLVEKLYGLVALALVTFALLPFGLARFFGPAGLALAGALGLASLAGLALLARPAWLRALARRAGPLRSRATVLADALATRPPDAGLVLRLMLLGLASHGASAALFVATGLALGVAASPLALLVVGNAIVLATLLPISVGGVGVREGTAVALLALVGVGATPAALVALLGYLAMQPPALVGGLLLLGRRASEGPLARAAAPIGAPAEPGR